MGCWTKSRANLRVVAKKEAPLFFIPACCARGHTTAFSRLLLVRSQRKKGKPEDHIVTTIPQQRCYTILLYSSIVFSSSTSCLGFLDHTFIFSLFMPCILPGVASLPSYSLRVFLLSLLSCFSVIFNLPSLFACSLSSFCPFKLALKLHLFFYNFSSFCYYILSAYNT